jgi:hypothetical protein
MMRARSYAEEASMAKANEDPEQVTERIRQLNEQVLETGRKAGVEFLEGYEQLIRTVADYQEKMADASQVDWVTNIVRAQAGFTRDIVGAYTKAARDTLGRR